MKTIEKDVEQATSVAGIELCLRIFPALHPVGESFLCSADGEVDHSWRANVAVYNTTERGFISEVDATFILILTAVCLIRMIGPSEIEVSLLL